MPTIRDYFDREARAELSVSNTFIFSNAEQPSIDVPARLVANFEANAKYLALFVPHVSDPAEFVAGVSGHVDRILSRLNEGPAITVGRRGEAPGSKADLAFAGRVRRMCALHRHSLGAVSRQPAMGAMGVRADRRA